MSIKSTAPLFNDQQFKSEKMRMWKLLETHLEIIHCQFTKRSGN